VIRNAGYFGVIFFYVLSGFLITYLLLVEKESMGRIDTRKFYMRRMLRIWPLYYLIITLSFFVLPFLWPWNAYWYGGRHLFPKLLLYILFLPNLATWIGPGIATCFHTYTIGYEEQFYLCWPWVIRMGKKYMLPLLAVLFFGHLLLEAIHLYFITHTQGRQDGVVHIVNIGLTLIIDFNLPAFSAGALAAIAYLNGCPGLLARMQWRGWSYVLAGGILCIMCFAVPGNIGLAGLVSLVFASLILHLVLRRGTEGVLRGRPGEELQRKPEGKWFRLLSMGGRISYGIYMFHPAVSILAWGCLSRLAIADVRWRYTLFLVLSFLLVTAVAYFSYRCIEQPFLKKKQELSPDQTDRTVTVFRSLPPE
jgi:peptidoglycan/LPS O-acetylase OafA/YrhL